MRKSCPLGAALILTGICSAQTYFPPPPAPAGNPVTTAKTLLGMALFFEEQLSSSGAVACATCHDFARGGIDPRAGSSRHPGYDTRFGTADDVSASPGVPRLDANQLLGSPTFGFDPQVTPRRTPTVLNAGYHTHLFYDGRATQGEFRDPLTNQIVLSGPVALENLMLGPPLNPVEMGHEGRTWTDVVDKLVASRPLVLASALPDRLKTFVRDHTYPQLFQTAFGSAGVTPARIAMALATYVRTLNTDQTRFDRYLAGTYQLTPEEALGLQLFRTPRMGAVSCNTCHGDFEARVRTEGPIAGAITMTSTGPYGAAIPTRLVFHNVGARPAIEDPGRSAITNVAAEFGKFRTASLRNVELTAPYFHHGGVATLQEVMDFYDRGGDFVQHQSPGLFVRNYTQHEKDALIALLRTLTDPRVARGTAPFDRPLLGSQNGKLPRSIGTGTPLGAASVRAQAPIAPVLGEGRFAVAVDGVSPGSFTLLMWDVALLPGGPDPGNLGFALATTANFAVFPVGPARAQAGTGAAKVQLAIPGDPGMTDVRLYAQWLVVEPAAPQGLALSNALEITLR